MRVLHLYAGNLYGGIETFLVTLAKTQALMPQMQHEFALCFPGRLSNELADAGAVVYQLGEVRVRKPWTVWAARSRLKMVLQQGQFDVVLCHSFWVQALFGRVVKQYQLPLVFYCHDLPSGKNWLEKWAKRTLPDLAVANSKYTESKLEVIYPNTTSQVVYCPVSSLSSSDRAQVRSQLQTPDEQVVIVQVGRLDPLKGHQSLLAGLKHLKHLPNWEMWIAGGVQRPQEQAYLAFLQAEAEKFGILERIKFLGHRSDVPNLLAAADIYCQPNRDAESFGISLVEALYAGLPVVTTEIGAAPEIVNPSCGVLVTPHDPTAIAQALEPLIMQPEARDRLSKSSVARAIELCDPQRQLHQLFAILDAQAKHYHSTVTTAATLPAVEL
jgi:glycosyltransferase involved in cell wall biosynthesis